MFLDSCDIALRKKEDKSQTEGMEENMKMLGKKFRFY